MAKARGKEIGEESADPKARRSLAVALARGFLRRCPNCGIGAMFCSYLGVNPRCPVCGEDLSAERADDAPAFITLFLGCLIGGAGVLLSDNIWPGAPLIVTALFWLGVIAVVSLLILPRIKGAVVGAEWALRMHAFGRRDKT